MTSDPQRGLQVTPGHLVSAPPPGAQRLDVAIDFPPSLEVAAELRVHVLVEERLAGDQLVGNDAQRVDIGPRVHLALKPAIDLEQAKQASRLYDPEGVAVLELWPA